MQVSVIRSPRISLFAALLLSACSSSEGLNMDWDLRGNGLDTTTAAQTATDDRPEPDARGVISYPEYQVVVAELGDTVTTVADRVGIPAGELATYNALAVDAPLRSGEILALPYRVDAAPALAPIAPAAPGAIDVTALASNALDEVQTTAPAPTVTEPAALAAPEPVRHQVARGETAFSIARTYGISAKALADWNGLGPDLEVREGQYLIIPTVSAPAPEPEPEVTAPGAGSPTPEPPSASEPLPDEETKTAAEVAETLPESPELVETRTAASAAAFAMPLEGSIIRAYAKGKNDGIDIAAEAGAPVRAAADGTVAAITADTEGTPIIVIKHADNILTVYAGVADVTVAKGAAVKRGQIIATVKAGDPAFLHFEVRSGIDSVDPMTYLQ